MLLHERYRDALVHRIEAERDAVFRFHNMPKSVLLADGNTIDALWGAYEKSITEYDIDPEAAYKDAMFDVLHIRIDDPHIPAAAVSDEDEGCALFDIATRLYWTGADWHRRLGTAKVYRNRESARAARAALLEAIPDTRGRIIVLRDVTITATDIPKERG